MTDEVKALTARIAALEGRLASSGKPRTAAQQVLAEIDDLEKKLDEGCVGCTGMDDLGVEMDASDKKDDADITASIVDPNGIEEQITQDRFTEVERIQHGEELTTNDSMRDTATAAFVGRMKKASERLDRVAEYLEKCGHKQMAYRVDRVADAIDAKVKQAEVK